MKLNMTATNNLNEDGTDQVLSLEVEGVDDMPSVLNTFETFMSAYGFGQYKLVAESENYRYKWSSDGRET